MHRDKNDLWCGFSHLLPTWSDCFHPSRYHRFVDQSLDEIDESRLTRMSSGLAQFPTFVVNLWRGTVNVCRQLVRGDCFIHSNRVFDESIQETDASAVSHIRCQALEREVLYLSRYQVCGPVSLRDWWEWPLVRFNLIFEGDCSINLDSRFVDQSPWDWREWPLVLTFVSEGGAVLGLSRY